ncbi:MAG: ribonuclease J [Candidatus Portnoybacteria bacterium CG03_land_8_20_14_0_80_41_10]|uniref:Ribonuclease J n=1 Tax=Candidatus Portnoybacteria bacterium CG03_land_8_20_14_0_80_41_10 TaxID=1974808 RepID=A0A2M7BU05_9BACT|nr:MAG: ribonuclease J [Candidatus Portnoybacteria bacterium CG03_land_8_20_14_0_80_41_10]
MQKTTKPASGGKTQNLRIIPLGGLEEVGRNMTVIEYGDDIMIIDMGLQFPEEDMPGIDYIIPNTAYLKDKKEKIRGIVITHAHYDHIGAIPHSMARLGNPPIYATDLTRDIILKRQEDFPGSPKLEIHQIKKTDKIKLGCFNIEFFHVNHNVPGGLGLVIDTPVGRLVHTGDFKFDHSPIGDEPADISRISEIANGGVLALFSDSCNAEKPGHSISESEIQNNLEIIFKESAGRIIIATFASLISRIQEVINLAEKYNRRVALDGYSMRTNAEIAKHLGYLKAKKDTLIKINRVADYPNEKVVVLCTGAQGEGNAVLMRIVNKEHRHVQVQKGDAVVFSSSVVPGNERTVQNLKDVLWRQGARVYHYQMMDIHAGGHGQVEDLKMMINLIRPKFFIPVHGNYYMLKLHGEIAESVGVPAENIMIANNGSVILLNQKSIRLSEEKVPANYVMVDGLGVGDVGEIVLRDRQAMAEDGMFVIIAVIESKTGLVHGEPDIISRGFVYLRESKDLLNQTREKVKEIVKQTASNEHTVNWSYVKDNIRDKIGQFLYTKTQRRPMVLPVVIEI